MSIEEQKPSNSYQRLNELLIEYKLTQKEFCKKTGLNKSVVSLYINGKREPMQDNIATIANAFNIDPAWLMGFDVPMKRADKMQKLTEDKTKEAMLQSISEDEMALRIALSLTKLSDYDKNMVAALVSGLLQKQTEPKQQQ